MLGVRSHVDQDRILNSPGETSYTAAPVAGPALGPSRHRMVTGKDSRMMNAMMERMGMTAATSGMPGTMSGPSSMPAGMNMMMVPRCTLKMEKCPGGMKMTCTCEDKVACGMVQSLCTMLAGGLCSCCLVLNGMTVCCCNLTMGLCKCEM